MINLHGISGQMIWIIVIRESLGITSEDEITTSKSFLDAYIINIVKCLSNGSYSAQFPWKDSHPLLPTNFSTCAHYIRALASFTYHVQDSNYGFNERVQHITNPTICHYNTFTKSY